MGCPPQCTAGAGEEQQTVCRCSVARGTVAPSSASGYHANSVTMGRNSRRRRSRLGRASTRRTARPPTGRCARRRSPVPAHSDDGGERPAGHRHHGGRQALLPGGPPQAKHWRLERPCGCETSQRLVRRSPRPRDRAAGELSFGLVPLEARCAWLCWCHVVAVARSLVARSYIENLAKPVHVRPTRGQSTAASPQLVRPGETARSP